LLRRRLRGSFMDGIGTAQPYQICPTYSTPQASSVSQAK
jgi:hypothetical protein